MTRRRAILALIVSLALADTVGAAMLWLLWQDKHGQAAPRTAGPSGGKATLATATHAP